MWCHADLVEEGFHKEEKVWRSWSYIESANRCRFWEAVGKIPFLPGEIPDPQVGENSFPDF